MKAIDIITLKTSQLKADPSNPNRMTEERYSLLVKSIGQVGFLQPVLVREPDDQGFYRIVDGHHRVKAAAEVGFLELPAVVVDVGDDYATVLQLSMNQLRGQLDMTAVGENLVDLFKEGWSVEDLELTGFTSKELDSLLEAMTTDEEDTMAQAIDPPEEPADDGRVWTLELVFATREDLRTAKKRLRKAAGRGKELSVGLMKMIGGE